MGTLSGSKVRKLTSLFLAFCLTFFAFAERAGAQACENVIVNCKTHRITIVGWKPDDRDLLRIDCGKNTAREAALDAVTYSGSGNIGSMIATTGNAITGGLDITGIDGMGVCGGKLQNGYNNASIFHTRPSRKIPQGADVSNGCIHVSEPVMNYLAMHCVQAPLEIKTANLAVAPPGNCSASRHAPARNSYFPNIQ